MRKSVLAVIGIAVAIIIVGFIIKSRNTPAPPSPGGPGDVVVAPTRTNFGETAIHKTDVTPQPLTPPRAYPTNDRTRIVVTSPPPDTNNTAFMTNWEEKLDNILTSEKPDPDKAKEMIEMFPKLSPDAQEEIAHHISNLTPDENYSLGQFLTNSTLSEAVLDVFTEDVLNRPNSVKLPLLLDVAKDPQHPKASEAKDILELFLENDYGTDWTTWQAKLDQWLKDNPD